MFVGFTLFAYDSIFHYFSIAVLISLSLTFKSKICLIMPVLNLQHWLPLKKLKKIFIFTPIELL